jgi:hypothetical protein
MITQRKYMVHLKYLKLNYPEFLKEYLKVIFDAKTNVYLQKGKNSIKMVKLNWRNNM